ncbi:pyridoxamine 5'-phosphate oxidase family protein [candidate division WOR-3 bacterium]|nr:pyridoxamine 5'-phosphate oxidase family protein [candidate division WOR-3 bacterium]
MENAMQYHPKRLRNEILDQSEINKIIKIGNHISLALSVNDNPYIVTLSYGFDKNRNCFYFHCANKGDKLDYIKMNSKVCGTIIEDKGYLETQCDHDYSSLIVRGNIFIVSDLEEKKHGLQILLNHLEKDPKPIFERNIKNDESYNKVTILRLDIESIIGKKYIG